MKKTMLFGALIALSLSSSVASAAVVHLRFLESCSHSSELRQQFRQGAKKPIPPTPPKLAAASDTDVLHCFLDIDVTLSTKTIIGSNTMTIRSNVDNLTTFEFRLINNYSISSILVDGVSNAFTRLDVNTVRLTISSRIVNSNDTFTVKINYGGVAPSGSGFGSIVFGTRSSGAAYVSTLSEPWHSHTWWPVKDENSDKATFDIWVTVPSPLVVAANGVRQGIDAMPGSKLRYRYRTGYPMAPYLLCFAATNYNTWTNSYTHTGGTMPLEFFIYPENDTSSNRTAWNQTVQMLATFKPLFGLYPFINEKYGIYQFTFGGGMEHQTMTGQGTFSESVTAHELGHQWWGDMVTCKTWHDIWLNEGFATYSEALWLENKPGSSGFAALKSAMQARKPSSVNGSVYCYDITSESRIFSTSFSYRKGGWVLHMLRKILGDSAFFAALANYRNRFEYDSAITDDFIQAVEDSYGQDLDWFFQPWVFQNGAAAYQYGTKVVLVDTVPYLLVKLVQNQSASYPTYTMPVDFRYTVNSQTFTRSLWNTARTQWYAFQLPANVTPTGMGVDPDGWILTTSTGTTSYTEGPPKIVDISVENQIGQKKITMKILKAISPTRADFKILFNGEEMGFKLKYDEVGGVLQMTVPYFGPANIEITAYDSLIATDNGMALDGEYTGSFPSGDGLPGGNLVFHLSSP
ncbi:MAG: M1 family metallopeptidase [Fimbriimonadaceae bacterium]|nr:M1 family metallopeptidase [Fimbriimonadaceae bacterium]